MSAVVNKSTGLMHLLFGRYECAITRRVTDEEIVSVTFYARSERQASANLEAVLERLRDHMTQHNQKVILLHREQLNEINRQVLNKTEELGNLHTKLERKLDDLSRLDAKIADKERRRIDAA